MLAWGAERAAAGAPGTGALGPVDGFGLEALTKGAEAGIAEGKAAPAEDTAQAAPATAG